MKTSRSFQEPDKERPIRSRGSKKTIQEGSIGLVVFGAGHVAGAEPPELFKGGAFEIRAETAKTRPFTPFELGCPGELPHGRRRK